MTTTGTTPPAGPAAPATSRTPGLIVAGVLAAAGAGLLVGTLVMDVPAGADSPGPRAFPALVALGCLVMGAVVALHVLGDRDRTARSADDAGPQAGTTLTDINGRALLAAAGTVAAFIVVLVPVGWLLSGTFLFWAVARALGSRRPVFDVFLALAFSAAVQLAFSAGLGLTLPPGILAGVF